MAFSFALIISLGILINEIFNKIKLPPLLGMLFLGILIGPYGLNWIDESLLLISADIRMMALIIILLRAGFGIDKQTLKKVGIPAIKLSFIPGILEGLLIMLMAKYLLDISFIEGGMLGFIIAAVSPAVIVPQMLSFIERRKGADKGIPTLILAGASIDDVVAITLFSTFLGTYRGKNVNLLRQLFNVPLSIILGIVLGIGLGLMLLYIFNHYFLNTTRKTIAIIAMAILLKSLEEFINPIIPIASLLGVMAIGFIISEKSLHTGEEIAGQLNKIWILAEILLFVLVGAQVNVHLAVEAGWIGGFIIAVGLIFRSIGVYISLIGTDLSFREKIFCMLSYIPKATVQAAMGAVPLGAKVPSGDLILALAVLSIILTAPLGAVAIKVSGEKILQ